MMRSPTELLDEERRRLLGLAAGAGAAVVCGAAARAQTVPWQKLERVDAGDLSIQYVDMGPRRGRPVILLHGWPYDIHSFAEIAPLLAAKGYRVIIPYLRGYGGTRFRSPDMVRNGEQAVLAVDVIALMDSLAIQRAIIGGFDWGARACQRGWKLRAFAIPAAAILRHPAACP
ncbi:hypothetical protein CLG96_08070 [Sphingomonas oleivorans]|uniref:AB hydrolase-1 domain-containing protein n=1 Tax=Sphingomonas oleivorans TaxID=1735121 RepID=A0A2T5FZ65_9SPHN|nr:alpha/beta fold hydrolase [Sphingomonas oleivorans]PTQ11861.1 hypothetical protein CLG96_08070 [Sphingomonas oleivorans]